jgi:alpha-ketoglutarate-dependent taurine dioxygenase
MLTMKETNRNPLIRVHPYTRKKLKIIAAHYEESMQDTVERLVQAEMERLRKGGQADVPSATREPGQDRPTR